MWIKETGTDSTVRRHLSELQLTERAMRPHPLISKRAYARVSHNVGQLSAFIQAHTNHMASPAATGNSRKRKSFVLSIDDKLKICDLAESGRSW